MSALPNLLQISAHSSRPPRFQRFRIPPQTQFGVGNGVLGTVGKSGEEIGTVTLLMRTLPNLFPIFPVSKVSAVSYSTPNADGCWKWDAVQKKKGGESGKNGKSG